MLGCCAGGAFSTAPGSQLRSTGGISGGFALQRSQSEPSALDARLLRRRRLFDRTGFAAAGYRWLFVELGDFLDCGD